METIVQVTPTTTTQLTMNSKSTTTFSGDSNLSCKMAIVTQNNILWPVMTSTGSVEQTLESDSSSGVVILHKGATVKENILGETIQVLFSGTITDTGSNQKFTNLVIATFSTS